MEAELIHLLEQSDYFEEQLDVLRRYRNEEFLRIGMNDIHGKLGQTEITIAADHAGRGLPDCRLSLAVRS